jgi:hypothetical protein
MANTNILDSTPEAHTGRPSSAYASFQKALSIGGAAFKRALEGVKSDEEKLRESESKLAAAVKLAEQFTCLKSKLDCLESERVRAIGNRQLVVDRLAELEATLANECFCQHPQIDHCGLTEMHAAIVDCRGFLAWFDGTGLPAHTAKIATARKELADFAKAHGFEIQ